MSMTLSEVIRENPSININGNNILFQKQTLSSLKCLGLSNFLKSSKAKLVFLFFDLNYFYY